MPRDRDSILAATRAALAFWAGMNRGELPDWPKQSIMASVITGRGTGGSTTIPDVCQLVEAAVNKLWKTERESRDMILLHYLQRGERREKIAKLGVSCREYYARLERAEYAVKIEIGY
jgi:hypothetical protein